MKIDKLEYLFSKNNLIGSKAISWGTAHLNETQYKTPSHVAVLINDFLVIESTMGSGVSLIPYENWKKKHEVVCKVPCPANRKWDDVIKGTFKLWGKKYDFKGVLFYTYHVLKNKFFKSKIPNKNQWESDSKFFCVELIENITGESYEMTSPVQLMNQFSQLLDQ